jgi:MYXO-CTERM domain-containing protein
MDMGAVGRIAVAAVLGILIPRVAEACQPTPWDANVLLPPDGDGPAPRNGAFLAIITAEGPHSSILSLTRAADGAEIEIEVERAGHDTVLIRGRALEVLEPQTEYLWTLGSVTRPFVTSSAADHVPPTSTGVTATLTGVEERFGCLNAHVYGETWVFEAIGTTEPIAMYGLTWGMYDAGEWSRWAPLAGDGEEMKAWLTRMYPTCIDVHVVDYGGNDVFARRRCFDAGPITEGSTGSTGTDDDTTSGGEEPPPGTTGDVDAAVDDDAATGCGCKVRTNAGASGPLALLMLVAVGAGRRRPRHPWSEHRYRRHAISPVA